MVRVEPNCHRILVKREDRLPGGPFRWVICPPRRATPSHVAERGFQTFDDAFAAANEVLAQILTAAKAAKSGSDPQEERRVAG